MDILAALPGFILAFILIFCYEYRIKLIKNKPRNRVHFYVARDKKSVQKYIDWLESLKKEYVDSL